MIRQSLSGAEVNTAGVGVLFKFQVSFSNTPNLIASFSLGYGQCDIQSIKNPNKSLVSDIIVIFYEYLL